MTSYDVTSVTQPAAPAQRRAGVRVLVLFAGSALAGAVVAPLVAWIWVLVSDPPSVPLGKGGGIFLGEEALNQQAGVTLWFFVIGAGFGAVAGLLIGWFGQRFGWLTVAAVLVLCAVGSLLSGYLGVHVFGPDPRAQAAGARVGDPIQLNVAVDARVAYLGWPIGGVVGVLAAISGWNRSDDREQMSDSSHIL